MSGAFVRSVNGALAATIAAHLPPWRRYFAKRVSAAEVDDFVREVFLRLQGHGLDEGIEHLDRYRFTVAASVLADAARRRSVRHAVSHASLEECQAQTGDLRPERIILDREAFEVIARAVSDLPAQDQRADRRIVQYIRSTREVPLRARV